MPPMPPGMPGIPPMPPIPGMPPMPPIPGMPPSNSSSATAASPSCSSSSTHFEKSVLMNCVRIFSFVRRGQYSAFFSFLRMRRLNEREVRFFADSCERDTY